MQREGEREGEKHKCVVTSHMPPIRELTHNPGMCPDWESNQGPCGSEASAQSTEPWQPGKISPFNISYSKGLVMMNSFKLTLSGKYFICPSILNDSFDGYNNIRCRS